jgi:LacI family transcriptional regulator, gluconate utilization system Gnt-I transcriptional repressor
MARYGGGRATLGTVARLAGVSSATVSRYLNNPTIVAKRTAERIRATIAETGYIPNLLAGGLASNRSRLVALIVPSVSHSIFNDTVDAIVDAVSDAGYTTMLGLSGEDDRRVGTVLDAVIARRPDGIILTGMAGDGVHRRRLVESGATIIETWDLPDEPLDVAVGFSHREVGEAVANMVLAGGYQRPFVISARGRRARLRYQGLADALRVNGREPPHVEYLGYTTRFGEGRSRFAALIDQGYRPDIVICSSDWLAQGVVFEAVARGINIPADVAVVGFGNLGFSVEIEPAITTVDVRGSRIGAKAVEILVGRAAGVEISNQHDTGFSVISRSTTRISS